MFKLYFVNQTGIERDWFPATQSEYETRERLNFIIRKFMYSDFNFVLENYPQSKFAKITLRSI